SLSVEHHRSRSLAAQVDPVELVAYRSEEVALRNERGMDPHVEPARRAQRDYEELRHVAEALGLAEVLELHAHDALGRDGGGLDRRGERAPHEDRELLRRVGAGEIEAGVRLREAELPRRIERLGEV